MFPTVQTANHRSSLNNVLAISTSRVRMFCRIEASADLGVKTSGRRMLVPLVLNERARIENVCCLGQPNADPCGIGIIDRESDGANLYGSAG